MQDVDKVPSIGLSYTVELPGKKALVMQSFVDRDCAKPELDAVLDKLRAAADRQFAFGAVQQLKLQLEQEEKLAADHVSRVADLDDRLRSNWAASGKRGDVKLGAKEQQEQRQAYAHTEECKKRIAKVKADIAEYEQIIAG